MLENYEPKLVWKYFEEICAIPHPSGHNEKISEYLVQFAKEHNLKYVQDEALNVIIWKNSTFLDKRYRRPVILQGHMDMVPEKTSDSEHDFLQDELDLFVCNGEGDIVNKDANNVLQNESSDNLWVGAKNTTLGGDDGIGVAMMLALLASDDIAHPAIECVFTTDEETGMTGAAALDCSVLDGRILLNLDSEDEGVILAGCAGGVRCELEIPIKKKENYVTVCEIVIDGLTGGHSGQEIQKYRANAHVLAGRILNYIASEIDVNLISLEGGTKDNAIPRTCKITLGVGPENRERLYELVTAKATELKSVYATTDPDMIITTSIPATAGDVETFSDKCTARVIHALLTLPDGVIRMSPDVEGLPETSLNSGILYTTDDAVIIGMLVRSSIESEKNAVVEVIKSVAKSVKAEVSLHGNYPGFKYQVNSPIRELMVETWRDMYGSEPVVEAIHAGVECGLFVDKIKELDAVSIGPDMRDIHTPEERLSIASTKRIWDYVVEILSRV